MKSIYSLFSYITTFFLIGFLFWIESIMTSVPKEVFQIARYLGLGLLVLISIKRKKMSLWIFLAMIMAIEVGIDFPAFSLEMKRFGTIFLRLIKSLVAPLVFATLVVGIAGHSDIKQVGRMGLKSILYFEIVTTIALFVGLVTINLTQAGVGIEVEASTSDLATVSTVVCIYFNGKDNKAEITPPFE